MKTDHKIAKPPRRTGRGTWKLQKHCSSCQAENTVHIQDSPSVQMIRGEEMSCIVPKYSCSECEATFMSAAQATEAVKIAVAGYQSIHGLLTAEEIKHARKRLGINSAEKLAEEIRVVSPATLKRIEAGVHVQDTTTNNAIRNALDNLEKDTQWTSYPQGSLYFKTGINHTTCWDMNIDASTLGLNQWSMPQAEETRFEEDPTCEEEIKIELCA
jgi:hypothetical protein